MLVWQQDVNNDINFGQGNHDVKFSYIGFNDFIKTIQLDDHKRVNVELIESEDLLEEGRWKWSHSIISQINFFSKAYSFPKS